MPDLPFGNNEKLTITAYKSSKRSRAGGVVGKFEAMFNPNSVRYRAGNHYRSQQALNSGGRPAYFAYTPPAMIELTLLIDGTIPGAVSSKASATLPVAPAKIDVARKVDDFLKLAYNINGSIHQPNFLKLLMGSTLKEVPCRLAQYTLTYTGFDEKGNPRRAEIDAVFIKEENQKKQNALIGRQSSDLTHRRTVKSKDSLPQLTREVYGSSEWYVQVARFNGLDHFRALKERQELIFPPLTGKDDA